MNTTAAQIATDDEMIAALSNSPEFVTVTDAGHLAHLLDMDTDEIPEADETPVDPMADDVATVREIILNRIRRYAPWGGMSSVSIAQVCNWWECDGMGPVPCERAIKSLIADGTVEETRRYGALAFDALN